MPQPQPDLIRVVVVDNLPSMRDWLVVMFQRAGGIQVVGVGANGEEAVRLTQRLRPDVVALDVRLSKLDGLAATRRIMRDTPTRVVLMNNSVTRALADLTREARRAGALTVVPKPLPAQPDLCVELIQSIRLMAHVPVIHHWGEAPRVLPAPKGVPVSVTHADRLDSWEPAPAGPFAILGIAASTGGPGALAAVLGPLPADYPLPILVVQHIKQGFAGPLADWLDYRTRLQTRLALDGETPRPGVILVAPDDYHLQVDRLGRVEFSQATPYKGLRPSANYLFDSLARVYGARAIGIVLTGMGDDGSEGLAALHQAHGFTVAQHERDCVVYGMPRAAVDRNAATRVLPLADIAKLLGALARRPVVVTDE